MSIKDDLRNCANRKERKALIAKYRLGELEESKKYSASYMTEMHSPKLGTPKYPLKAFRSKHFLAQIYHQDGYVRISVNKIAITDEGDWVDGITWEQLQWIKEQTGYGDQTAVEVYPSNADVINEANMRHLFVLKEPLPFVWKKRT